METGDVRTIKIPKNSTGAFMKAIELEWLRYLGFSDKEIDGKEAEIVLVIKADISDRKKLKFIGIGRPEAGK